LSKVVGFDQLWTAFYKNSRYFYRSMTLAELVLCTSFNQFRAGWAAGGSSQQQISLTGSVYFSNIRSINLTIQSVQFRGGWAAGGSSQQQSSSGAALNQTFSKSQQVRESSQVNQRRFKQVKVLIFPDHWAFTATPAATPDFWTGPVVVKLLLPLHPREQLRVLHPPRPQAHLQQLTLSR
jgi:hypothetical protein